MKHVKIGCLLNSYSKHIGGSIAPEKSLTASNGSWGLAELAGPYWGLRDQMCVYIACTGAPAWDELVLAG